MILSKHIFWLTQTQYQKQIQKLEDIARYQEINTNIDEQLEILFSYNIERFQESSF